MPIFDQNKKLQINIDDSEKILEAFKNNGSVTNTVVLNEPLEKSKLLSLLKNAEHLKEINQSVKNETVTNHEKAIKNSGEMEDEISHKFQRLAYLTDIQNTAATESAQLLLQLKNLKLRQDAKK